MHEVAVPADGAASASALRHRMAEATISLRAGGEPVANREVVVAQRSHAFLFGCTGFEFIPWVTGERGEPPPHGSAEGDGDPPGDDVAAAERAERAAELWLGLFNFATLPFYWGRYERTRGRPDVHRLQETARWFVDRGCRVKGHPLTWHTVTPAWLLDLPQAEIVRTQVERTAREVRDFAGVIDTWDVVNEAVIMPIFAKEDNGITRICREMGRIPLIRAVFAASRDNNPAATLLLNDFDLSAAFECLIEGVLEAGVRIDALGLQSHMHQGYWGEEKTLAILDRFSRYGLPIHFTETTIVSGELMPPDIEDLNDFQVAHWPTTPEGEERQADEIVRHYTTLLSHPSVAAVTYWGMSDGSWLGAPGGLVRVDGTPKPSYRSLHSRVRGAWWVPPTTVRTDAAGTIRVSGFLGEYQVTAGDRSGCFQLDGSGRPDSSGHVEVDLTTLSPETTGSPETGATVT